MTMFYLFLKAFGEPTIRFVVEGKQYGFVSGNNKWNRRTKGPREWCDVVREAAQKAGFPKPEHIVTSKTSPIYVVTESFFESNNHPDPENVHKLIKDALFYKAKNGDKFTGGAYEAPTYDEESPRTEVSIWIL
jgi:hypothetical protein